MGNVDTKALTDMAAALGNYINEVNGLLEELSAAARECRENLADDSISVDAANRISQIVGGSKESLQKASQLKNRLQSKASELILIRNM